MSKPENPALKSYQDPGHPGNGPEYLTGGVCVEPGCDGAAGTAWSKHWCFACNVRRMDAIGGTLEAARDALLRAREAE